MTKYFSLSLEKVGKDWGGHIVAVLIYLVITSALGFIYVGWILNGAFIIGYYHFLKKKFAGENAEIADLFMAFKESKYILPSILASIVSGIITFIGFICLIIPGIMAVAAFMFAYLIILDGEMDFWPALMKSKDIVSVKWFDYCMFIIVGGLIMLAGALVLGVGLLAAMPIVLGAVVLAYNDTKAVQAAPVEKPVESPIKES